MCYAFRMDNATTLANMAVELIAEMDTPEPAEPVEQSLEIGHAPSAEPNTITANGRGEVKTHPDSVRVDVGVSAKASTLEEAQNTVNKGMFAVTAALKGLTDLPGLKLETQTLYFAPEYSRGSRLLASTITGYSASNHVLATLEGTSPDVVSGVASTLVNHAMAAGANNLGGISFYKADTKPEEAQALTIAVKNARKDALAMAEAAGVRLTGVHSIEQSSGSRYGSYRGVAMMAAKSMAMESTPIEAGEQEVHGSVTVRYLFA